jgi:hypothetical protein
MDSSVAGAVINYFMIRRAPRRAVRQSPTVSLPTHGIICIPPEQKEAVTHATYVGRSEEHLRAHRSTGPIVAAVDPSGESPCCDSALCTDSDHGSALLTFLGGKTKTP